jgi:ketopantoate reductase
MKIQVLGAGVMGSIYAGCLARAGHSVTLLARGERLTQLRRRGLVLDDVTSGESFKAPITIASSLDQLTDLDLLVVAAATARSRPSYQCSIRSGRASGCCFWPIVRFASAT